MAASRAGPAVARVAGRALAGHGRDRPGPASLGVYPAGRERHRKAVARAGEGDDAAAVAARGRNDLGMTPTLCPADPPDGGPFGYPGGFGFVDRKGDDGGMDDRQLPSPPPLVGDGLPVPCVDGQERPYLNLDSAASASALPAVAERVEEFLPWYSSVHRGAGYKSRLATNAYEEARLAALRFAGRPGSEAQAATTSP